MIIPFKEWHSRRHNAALPQREQEYTALELIASVLQDKGRYPDSHLLIQIDAIVTHYNKTSNAR
jgi:hypothetical protein